LLIYQKRETILRKHAFTLIDLVIVIAAAAILLFVGLCSKHLGDEVANRVRCAANLKSIGQALLLYANENRGSFPRTRYDLPTTDKPVFGTPYEAHPDLGAQAKTEPFAKDAAPEASTRPQPNDVTAAIYLLMRTQDITSNEFVCPSTTQTHWDFGGGTNDALSWTNWNGNAGIRAHLSYSMQNPYASQAAAREGFKFNSGLGREFALVTDMNPGTDALLAMTPTSTPQQLRAGNSLNHQQDGQNVLFGDGRVQFSPTPFAGADEDNIFTYGPSGTNKPKGGDGIVGSPTGPNDCIVLPTARAIGMIDGAGKRVTGSATQPSPG
jgi:hypothetical protein